MSLATVPPAELLSVRQAGLLRSRVQSTSVTEKEHSRYIPMNQHKLPLDQPSHEGLSAAFGIYQSQHPHRHEQCLMNVKATQAVRLVRGVLFLTLTG